MMRTPTMICSLVLAPLLAMAESGVEFPLWPGVAPGAEKLAAEQRKMDPTLIAPTLKVFLPAPEKANGTAVVVLPGGGYGGLAVTYEGDEIAQWFADRGVVGFTLRYRRPVLGKERLYDHTIPLMDAQRALRTVRSRAAEWNIKPDRIGIMGFSAGGHLASTAGVHFDAGNPTSTDAIERVSSRPDFLMPIYAVLDMSTPGVMHEGSRRNLLGEKPDDALIARFSTPGQVTSNTPPTFLVASFTDTVVPAENSIRFYQALKKAGVPAELHVFEQGPHGFGMKAANGLPVTAHWPGLLESWMRQHGWLPPVTGKISP